MFCPKCGSDNAGGVMQCTSCGAELVGNQQSVNLSTKPTKNFSADTLLGIVKGFPGKVKALPKIAKQISIAVLALVVVVIAFSSIGSAIANPKNIVKGYFQARLDSDYKKMYSYLALEKSDFINKNNFEKSLAGTEKLKILNYEIKSETSSNASELTKTYRISYIIEGSTSTQSETVTLVKSKAKKLLFFNDYNVALDEIIVIDYQITVPEGATAYVDGIKLTEIQETQSDSYYSYNESPASVTYVIPKIFPGTHDLKVEHPLCSEYTNEIEIERNSNTSYSVSGMQLNSEIKTNAAKKTEEAYRAIVQNALDGKAFSDLKLDYTSDSEALEGIQEQYERLASNIKREDGTGYKSITFKNFTDDSSQETLNSSSTYSCELRYEYDSITVSKNWYTQELTETSSSYTQYSSVRITFVFEDGKLVIQSLYDIGI